MAFEGSVQTCLRSIAIADGHVPAGMEVVVGVGNVDLGLKGAGGRIEREARADDFSLAGGTRDRLQADRGRILGMDEKRGQLGYADEDAHRVGLLENEQRPAARAGTGLQVVARADVALGDHAVVRGFDLAVFDQNACLAFLGLGDLKLGAGLTRRRPPRGRDRQRTGSCAETVSETIASAWSRAAAASSKLTVRLVANLHVEHALGDQRLQPFVLRLPPRVAGLGPFDTGLGRRDSCLGRLHLGLGRPEGSFGHADHDLGHLHRRGLLGSAVRHNPESTCRSGHRLP